MLTRRILFSVLSVVVLFISGCKVETPPVTIQITPDNGQVGSTTTTFSCAASIPSTMTSVVSGQLVPITVVASGGVAPYTFPGLVGTFASQVTFSDSFQNTGTQPIQASRNYSIADSTGASATCTLTVTVVPSSQPSNLACNFSISPSTVAVGQTEYFTVNVSGGVAPYTASNYTPGANTTYASALTQSSSAVFNSQAIYGASGLTTASVTMTDSVGSQVTCSQTVTVGAAPSVSVTASPSTTVASGNPITLTAVASNFSPTPDITFTTSSGGVTFTAVGNSVVVNTTDYLAHTVLVNVTATNGTQQAQTSITLYFTATQTLSCNLSHASGYYQAGDSVTFNVSSDSGVALALTSISAQDGTVTDYLGQTAARIQFSSSGYKNVYATARLVSTGALCNNGATLTDSIYINPAPVSLSCSAVTSPNPSVRGQFFLARANVPSGAGVGTVRLVKIETSWYANTSYSYYNDATSAYLAIYNSGSFPIVLTVRDEAGNTAQCSTTQVVY